jgi:hypothetical protein
MYWFAANDFFGIQPDNRSNGICFLTMVDLTMHGTCFQPPAANKNIKTSKIVFMMRKNWKRVLKVVNHLLTPGKRKKSLIGVTSSGNNGNMVWGLSITPFDLNEC